MKKAFAVILLLALVLAGCANQCQSDPTGTEAFQANSHPTFSTEVTEVTERLDDKMAEDKLTPTETEATSGKDNSNEMTDTVEKSTDPSTSKPDPTKPQDNDEQSQTKPPQEVETIPTTPPATEPVPLHKLKLFLQSQNLQIQKRSQRSRLLSPLYPQQNRRDVPMSGSASTILKKVIGKLELCAIAAGLYTVIRVN